MTAPREPFHWPTPNGWKISIALEEMGLPYILHLVNIREGQQFQPKFLKISPNNRIPAIVDPNGPDEAPVSIFEAGDILLYLKRKTGLFGSQDDRGQFAVEEWLMWEVGGVGSMAGKASHFIKYAPQMDPPLELPYAKTRYFTEVGRMLRVLDTRLFGCRYFSGDTYTIADMAIWPWVFIAEEKDHDLSALEHLRRWISEIGARPEVQRVKQLEIGLHSGVGVTLQSMKVLYGQQ